MPLLARDRCECSVHHQLPLKQKKCTITVKQVFDPHFPHATAHPGGRLLLLLQQTESTDVIFVEPWRSLKLLVVDYQSFVRFFYHRSTGFGQSDLRLVVYLRRLELAAIEPNTSGTPDPKPQAFQKANMNQNQQSNARSQPFASHIGSGFCFNHVS